MFTRLTASNFKSIESLDIELKPLTIFTGLNSTGKSNILEALWVFYQVYELDEKGTSPNINNVFRYGVLRKYPLPISDYIIYKKNTMNELKLQIEVLLTRSKRLLFMKLLRESPFFKGLRANKISYSFSYRFSDSKVSQYIYFGNNILFGVESSKNEQPHFTYPIELSGKRSSHYVTVFLSKEAFMPNEPMEFSPEKKIIEYIIDIFIDKCKGIYFLSGLRGNIDIQYEISNISDKLDWVGQFGENIVPILSRTQTKYPRKRRKIQEWSKLFKLSDISAGIVDRGYLESNYMDEVLKININTALAGLGSRQFLSIISQVILSERGDTILIEEPEISLHPENQVLLHKLFSEAVKEGKQIICTTHSPFFVLALSKIVKANLIEVNNIAVFHVTKTKNGTKASQMKINDKGFIDGGIPSFMKVELDLFNDWSKSLEEEE